MPLTALVARGCTRAQRESFIRTKYAPTPAAAAEGTPPLPAATANRALFKAVLSGDVRGMRLALRHSEAGGCSSPAGCSASIQTLLTLAAGGYAGLNEGCKAYLTSMDPRSLTSPLHLASCSGQLSLAAMLVFQSAWTGEGVALDGEGRTPFEALLHSRFVAVAKECAAAAAAAAGVGSGSDTGASALDGNFPALPLHPSSHPLLLQLTPSLLDALVALLLAVQPREHRSHALALGKACVESALAGQFEEALQPLEAERRCRGALAGQARQGF